MGANLLLLSKTVMPNQNNRKRKSKTSFKKKVLAVINERSELKQLVTTVSTTSIVETGKFALVESASFVIPQGDGDGQRVGDVIYLKDIDVRVSLNAGSAQGQMRLFAYQELEDEEPTSLITALNPDEFWPRLRESDAKYRILMDKSFSLSSQEPVKHFNLKLNNFPIKKLSYDAGATTIEGGGLINMNVSTMNTTADQMSGTATIRVRYYD